MSPLNIATTNFLSIQEIHQHLVRPTHVFRRHYLGHNIQLLHNLLQVNDPILGTPLKNPVSLENTRLAGLTQNKNG